MRLPDFSFPSGTIQEILANASTFNEWVQTVQAENFVKAGVSGEGEPQTLPGILDSISVGGKLLEDNVETADKSGSVKIISGWSDCDLSISLILIDIPTYTADTVTPGVTRFDCLKQISQTFKRQKDAKPCVFTVQHPHINAWGLSEFIFVDLKSRESRGKRIITCTLEFDEYDSRSGKSQDRTLGATISMDAAATTSENPVVTDEQRAGLGAMEAKYGRQ
jgi:hypothetical protein